MAGFWMLVDLLAGEADTIGLTEVWQVGTPLDTAEADGGVVTKLTIGSHGQFNYSIIRTQPPVTLRVLDRHHMTT